MNRKIRKIVITGVMSGISIFLGLTHLGFIPWFAGASFTVMHVPVIIGAVLEGPIVGVVVGFIFGTFSLVQAAIAPTGVFDPLFVNPFVSIAPRLFIGPIAWLVYIAIKKFKEVPAIISAGIIGSLTNTILVLTTLGFYELLPGELSVTFSNIFNKAIVLPDPLPKEIIGTIFLVNGLPEAAIAAILTVAVVTVWKGIETKRGGSSV